MLTRQPQAIEALGATTVLCVDKTGTLTHNRMEVVALSDGERMRATSRRGAADGRFAALLRQAALASARAASSRWTSAIYRLLDAGRCLPATGAGAGATGVLPGRPFVSQTGGAGRRAPGGCIAIKGAPEAVLARCADRSAAAAERSRCQADAWAAEGLRVIARRASRTATSVAAPPTPRLAVPLGLLGFEDPCATTCRRPSRECRQRRHARGHDHRRRARNGAGDRAQGRTRRTQTAPS